MNPLTILPPELLLEIISHLPLCTLPSLRRASQEWNELITANEDVIFRYVVEEVSVGVGPRCQRPDRRHGDWKAVCQCAIQRTVLRKCKAASIEHLDFGIEGFAAWRIKVDERRGWMFATTGEGEGDDVQEIQGLVVMDLTTKAIIQRLPEVKQYAHIEYDAGYLVATGPTASTMTVYQTPQPGRHNSSEDNGSDSPGSTPPPVPPLSLHGTITSRGFRALRMHGTSLVTASTRRIEVFDVVSLQLVQRIDLPAGLIETVMYVEMDEDFIFICALGHVLPPPIRGMANAINARPYVYVYHRSPLPDTDPYFLVSLNPVAGLAYTPIAHQNLLSAPCMDETDPRFQVDTREAKPLVPAEIAPFELTHRVNGSEQVPPFRPDVPVACHYGTRHLVILCRNGSMLFVQDYKTTLRLSSEEQHSKIFTLTLPSNGPDYWNLAVEGDAAYVTSYQERLFEPWALLIVIDLASLKSHAGQSPFQVSAELDIRSWDIPLPVQIAGTHSLQATSEGVYMPVQIVPLRRNPEQVRVEEGWAPPDYRRDAPEKTTVLSLRYSRH